MRLGMNDADRVTSSPVVGQRGAFPNQSCHVYDLPILRREPLGAAVTGIVSGETLIRFL
jgi:hypothetical protein